MNLVRNCRIWYRVCHAIKGRVVTTVARLRPRTGFDQSGLMCGRSGARDSKERSISSAQNETAGTWRAAEKSRGLFAKGHLYVKAHLNTAPTTRTTRDGIPHRMIKSRELSEKSALPQRPMNCIRPTTKIAHAKATATQILKSFFPINPELDYSFEGPEISDGLALRDVVHSSGDGIKQLTRRRFKLFDNIDGLCLFHGVAVPIFFMRFMQEPNVTLHGRTQQ